MKVYVTFSRDKGDPSMWNRLGGSDSEKTDHGLQKTAMLECSEQNSL